MSQQSTDEGQVITEVGKHMKQTNIIGLNRGFKKKKKKKGLQHKIQIFTVFKK